MPSPDLNDLRAKLLAPKPGARRGGQAPDPLSDFPSESSRRFAWGQKLAGYRKDLAGRLRMPRLQVLSVRRVRGVLSRLWVFRLPAPVYLLRVVGGLVLAAGLIGVVWALLWSSEGPSVAAPRSSPAAAPPASPPAEVAATEPVAPANVPTPPRAEPENRPVRRQQRTAEGIAREPGDIELPARSSRRSQALASRPAASGAATSPPPPKVDEVVYADFGAGAPPPTAKRPVEDLDPSRVYTAADADVRPPVPVRAWFYTSPPAGVSRASLSEVEVVVSASGEVVSVRMVAGPRTYADSGALSAIKAGRFRPAVKAGRPVSYRQTVWIKVPER